MSLIKVFKPSNPDQPLFADQGQINAMPDKLIKWDQREAFLAGRKTKAPAATKAGPGNAESGAEAAKPPAKPAGPTKAELLAECQRRGIAVTKRMTVEQLQAALDGPQDAGPQA